MKKLLLVTLLSSMLFFSNVIYATPVKTDIKVAVKNEWIQDEIFIENGRTLLPLRTISEKLGYKVVWEADTETITIYSEYNNKINQAITLKVGEKYILNLNTDILNDNQSFKNTSFDELVLNSEQIDTAPIIINNKTYVPIKAISDSLGVSINWSEAKRTVVVGNGISKEEFLETQEEHDKYTQNLIGDSYRKIYYDAGNDNVKYIRPNDRVFFNSNEEAKKAGYRPQAGADMRFRNEDTSYLKEYVKDRGVDSFNFDEYKNI